MQRCRTVIADVLLGAPLRDLERISGQLRSQSETRAEELLWGASTTSYDEYGVGRTLQLLQ